MPFDYLISAFLLSFIVKFGKLFSLELKGKI